jgi:hypothetical protein
MRNLRNLRNLRAATQRENHKLLCVTPKMSPHPSANRLNGSASSAGSASSRLTPARGLS